LMVTVKVLTKLVNVTPPQSRRNRLKKSGKQVLATDANAQVRVEKRAITLLAVNCVNKGCSTRKASVHCVIAPMMLLWMHSRRANLLNIFSALRARTTYDDYMPPT